MADPPPRSIVATAHLVWDPRTDIVFERASYFRDAGTPCIGYLSEDDDLCPLEWRREWIWLMEFQHRIGDWQRLEAR